MPLLSAYWRATRSYRDGYSAFTYGYASVRRVERDMAELVVSRRKGAPVLVRVTLVENEPVVTCTCGVDEDGVCEHRVAALFALERYLRAHPPCVWQQALASAIKPGKAAKSPDGRAGGGVVVFSLFVGHETSLHFVPYLIARRHLPDDLPLESPELVKALSTLRAVDVPKPIYNRADFSTVRNATPELIAAVGLLAGNAYNSYYSQEPVLDTVIPLLAHCPTFLSGPKGPLTQPLAVVDTPATVELTSERLDDGVRLSLWMTLDGQRFRVEPKSVFGLGRKAGWLLHEATLFRANAVPGLIDTFLQYPEVDIPDAELDDFISGYLLTLAEQIPFSGEFSTAGEVRAEPVKRLYLREEAGELCAELRFGYDAYEFTYAAHQPEASLVRREADNALLRVCRVPEAEGEAWKALGGFGLKRGAEPALFALRKTMGAVDFLLHQVPKLAEAGFEVFGEEALTSARVNRHRPTISFTVASGIDWFDVQAVVHFGELEVSLKELRRALHRRERYVKLADGTIGALPEDWLDRYRRLLELGEADGDRLHLSNGQITVLDALLDGADYARVDEAFTERRRRLRDFAAIEHRDAPPGLVGELRPYQQAGYEWLHFLHEYGFGGCLADDMGTGKTIQALALLQSLRASGHAKNASLIVMPRSLLFNWQREAARFTPELRVLVHADSDRDTSLETFADYDVVLTTYGVLLRDIEVMRQYAFHYAILDESQAVKNPVSQSAKAVRLLCADHRLVLTGTPVENNTGELWSQFAFLNPGLLGSQEYFRKEFALPIEKNGDAEAAQALRRLVFPFILRRTKEQVASDLPPRTERILYCEMEPEQEQLYERMRDRYRGLLLGLIDSEGMENARMKILEGLLRLRQLSNHPRLVDSSFTGASAKFDELLELLETLRAEGHKALVFSQFTRMLALVREALDARGIPYQYLDGQTKDRQARVDAFQEQTETPFFLISLRAGGVGLNLTAADYVIHIDPWWNPAVEMQASDRAHRIGQDKPVFIYKLIVKASVEEKIVLLQDRKRALVDQLIQHESSFFKSLSRDDVTDLFS